MLKGLLAKLPSQLVPLGDEAASAPPTEPDHVASFSPPQRSFSSSLSRIKSFLQGVKKRPSQQRHKTVESTSHKRRLRHAAPVALGDPRTPPSPHTCLDTHGSKTGHPSFTHSKGCSDNICDSSDAALSPRHCGEPCPASPPWTPSRASSAAQSPPPKPFPRFNSDQAAVLHRSSSGRLSWPDGSCTVKHASDAAGPNRPDPSPAQPATRHRQLPSIPAGSCAPRPASSPSKAPLPTLRAALALAASQQPAAPPQVPASPQPVTPPKPARQTAHPPPQPTAAMDIPRPPTPLASLFSRSSCPQRTPWDEHRLMGPPGVPQPPQHPAGQQMSERLPAVSLRTPPASPAASPAPRSWARRKAYRPPEASAESPRAPRRAMELAAGRRGDGGGVVPGSALPLFPELSAASPPQPALGQRADAAAAERRPPAAQPAQQWASEKLLLLLTPPGAAAAAAAAAPSPTSPVPASRSTESPMPQPGREASHAHAHADDPSAASPFTAAAAAVGAQRAAAEGLGAEAGRLLALSPNLPAAMRRQSWGLADYAVSRRLYKGGTSSVYKASCTRSGQPVALKVYFLSRVPEAVLHMVVREVEIHAATDHPHIIQLHAAFQTPHHLVLVQEWAPHGDLFGLARSLPQRLGEAALVGRVLRPLAGALAYLHARGVVHRDIKPENVLFGADWTLKLADFGVSIDLLRERAVTRAGTASYMAPEVCRCPLKEAPEDNKADASLAYGTAADVWGLGVLAYEMMVGFTPMLSVPAMEPGAGGHAGRGGGSPVLIFPSSVSREARVFVAATMAEQPADRPTARELLALPWLRAWGAEQKLTWEA